MAILKYTINSILGGLSPLRHGAGKGQFLAAQGIDPELQLNGRANGFIMPLTHSKFSSTAVSGYSRWIEVSEKAGSTKVYTYNSDGEVISYNNSLGSETAEVTTITNGNGSGMCLLNDHLICAGTTDISVVGPLTTGVAVTNTFWTGTAGESALTANTSMPTVRGVAYPYHAMHVHGDGYAYFCDYASGQGLIHRLGITTGTADSGSQYNVLDLPQSVRPMDIESYGTYLAIIGSSMLPNTAAQIRGGHSYLFLWDTFSDSFDRQIEIPSALVTAILNVNGILYIWGSSANNGFQVYTYAGGNEVTQIVDSSLGTSPMAGAVDQQNGRIFWGGYDTTGGADNAVIFALGYQSPQLPRNALNIISNLAAADNVSSSMISSLKCIDYAGGLELPIVGWVTNATTYGLSKPSTSAAKTSFFHSESFIVGKKFKVRSVNIPLTGAVTSGVVVEPQIVLDASANTKTLNTINDTNYSGETRVRYRPIEIEAASTAGVYGYNDFYLRLYFNAGTSDIGVALPIEIEIETMDD